MAIKHADIGAAAMASDRWGVVVGPGRLFGPNGIPPGAGVGIHLDVTHQPSLGGFFNIDHPEKRGGRIIRKNSFDDPVTCQGRVGARAIPHFLANRPNQANVSCVGENVGPDRRVSVRAPIGTEIHQRFAWAISVVLDEPASHLPEIANASGAFPFLHHTPDRREKQGGQNRDDRDHDEKLNQCESAAGAPAGALLQPIRIPPHRGVDGQSGVHGKWMGINWGTGSCEPANTCDYLPFLKTTVKKKMERLTVSVIKDVMVKYFSEFEPRITP
jgi:hypothetical protein